MVKYEAIAKEIRSRITDGIYKVESLIPDQVTLSEEFKVSRMTIKKALDILAMEGLIYRQRGSGTFVMKNSPLNEKNAAVRPQSCIVFFHFSLFKAFQRRKKS